MGDEEPVTNMHFHQLKKKKKKKPKKLSQDLTEMERGAMTVS